MKRALFCASLLAVMAASCTQDEFQQAASVENNATKPGISFVGDEATAPTTKGEISRDENGDGIVSYPFKWYAEQDRINIWGKYVYKGGTIESDGAQTTSGPNTEISALDPTDFATYKATKSENNAYFTAVSDGDILWFGPSATEEDPAEFVAVYPTTSRITNIANGKYRISPLPILADQTQESVNDGSSVTERLLMVGHGTGYQEKDYESVGEKVHLTLNRPFTALTVKTKGLDKDEELASVGEKLSDYFGNLESIKIEAKGYDVNNDGDYDDYLDIKPSYLDYGQAAFEYDPAQALSESKFVDASSGDEITDWSSVTDAKNYVELTIKQPWSDAYNAYIAIKPVDRSSYRNSNHPAEENMEITYKFGRITLMANETNNVGTVRPNAGFTTAADWTSSDANNFVGPLTLDISKFRYLVTNSTSAGNDRVLIINNARLMEGDILKNGKVVWNGQELLTSYFSTIITKMPLYDKTQNINDYASLNTFSNLKKLVVINDTEIPGQAFDRADLANLEEINYPKVTVIDPEAFTGFGINDANGLKNVYLKSYDFLSRDIAETFLCKASLEKLDMSAAEKMNVGFPRQGFTLEGYTKLKEVTIGHVTVGANAFDGCVVLATMKGVGTEPAKITIDADAVAAFRKTALKEINLVETTVIPGRAFQGCDDLVTVKTNGTNPTSIGEYAFSKCSALETVEITGTDLKEIDQYAFQYCTNLNSFSLAGAETIGQYAFDQCSSLTTADLKATNTIGMAAFRGCSSLIGEETGTPSGKRNVLHVGAEEVGGWAFEGCSALRFVEFMEATVVEAGLLHKTTILEEVQFDKVFTCNFDAAQHSQYPTFGPNIANMYLFVNADQANVSSTVLTTEAGIQITFKAIQEAKNITVKE